MHKKLTECGEHEKISEKGRLKEEDICQKAAQLFSSKGYINTSLRDIADAVGMSKGGIFHYFSTKEEILFLILSRYMDRTLKSLKEKLATNKSPQMKIREFVHHHLAHFRDNYYESRLILREKENLCPEYLKMINSNEDEYMRIVINAIKEISDGSHEAKRKTKVAAYTLMGMCNWPYVWYKPSGAVSAEELADTISQIFLGEFLSPSRAEIPRRSKKPNAGKQQR